MPKSLIFNDDSIINDYGFRIMTSGIRIDRFQKNPIMLYVHQRSNKYDSRERTALPIGKATNLRIEGGQYICDPVFDEKDEFAQTIASKWEQGILNMGSIGANPITTSSDPQYLLEGQTRETVVTCELMEISIADIGANENCCALYTTDGARIKLTSDNENPIPIIKQKETETIIKIENNMKSIALLLGMPETATEQEIHAKISIMLTANQTMTTELTSIKDGRILELVNLGIANKKFTADKKDHMISLGKTAGYDTLKDTIEMMSPALKPGEIINMAKPGAAPVELTFDELLKKGVKAIEDFKKEKPQEYIALYKAKYGVVPQDKALEV